VTRDLIETAVVAAAAVVVSPLTGLDGDAAHREGAT
jgi:hypothetical protein